MSTAEQWRAGALKSCNKYQYIGNKGPFQDVYSTSIVRNSVASMDPCTVYPSRNKQVIFQSLLRSWTNTGWTKYHRKKHDWKRTLQFTHVNILSYIFLYNQLFSSVYRDTAIVPAWFPNPCFKLKETHRTNTASGGTVIRFVERSGSRVDRFVADCCRTRSPDTAVERA